jgi:hypothetical protein
MVAQVGYSVVRRSRGRVTPCAVCTVHMETRARVSWLSLKTTGTVSSDLASKLMATVFSGLALKSVVMIFSSLVSKLVATVSPGLTLKPVVLGFPVWALKPATVV